jgi:hypothetical protein
LYPSRTPISRPVSQPDIQCTRVKSAGQQMSACHRTPCAVGATAATSERTAVFRGGMCFILKPERANQKCLWSDPSSITGTVSRHSCRWCQGAKTAARRGGTKSALQLAVQLWVAGCIDQRCGWPPSVKWPSSCFMVLLEKLTVSQLVKKLPTFYGSPRYIAVVTTAHLFLLSSTK